MAPLLAVGGPRYFYPRSPCGERLRNSCRSFLISYFYPRSPCGERRHLSKFNTPQRVFLSTLSLRRATSRHCGRLKSKRHFYPRSPCGERRIEPIFGKINTNFYPRSPCGERPDKHAQQPKQQDFYPRSPCGERPKMILSQVRQRAISIHALLAESDGHTFSGQACQ